MFLLLKKGLGKLRNKMPRSFRHRAGGSIARLVILERLKQSPATGRELSFHLKERLGTNSGMGTIYVVMEHLEELGFVGTSRIFCMDPDLTISPDLHRRGFHLLPKGEEKIWELRKFFPQIATA